jgi:hypothetical protein
MPTASADNLGWIVQFTGTTDSTYTHGYLYECVSDGQDPATYSWEEVEVQASSGGGLPSQTGQSGKFLTTDGTDASWSNKPLVNKATVSGALVVGDNATDEGCDEVTILGSSATVGGRFFSGSIAIGSRASVMGGGNSIVIGERAESRGDNTVAVGYAAKATAEGAIQLGTGGTNSVANTFKVWNNNGNFEMMSADGTIPAARHAALPSADGTYVLKLVIANGVPTLSWVAE